MKKRNSVNLNDDQKEIRNFIIILVVIVLIVVGIYFISTKVSEKNNYNYDEVKEGSINYDTVNVGTMFNRPEEEYYVALYKNDDAQAIYYASILSMYTNSDKALHVYYCDLANKFNESYYDKDNSNPKAKTIDDLKVGDFTLVKIKKGQIVKYYEDIEKVKEDLVK